MKDTGILFWSNIVRVVAGCATAIIVSVLWALGTLPFDPRPMLFILIPIYLMSGGVWYIVAKKSVLSLSVVRYLQLVADFIIVIFQIHFTGNIHSEFLFLYAIPVVTASLISIRATVVTIAASFTSYVLLEYLEYLRVVKTFPESFSVMLQPEEINHAAILLLLTSVIAFQSWYYLERIKESNKRLMDVKDELLFRTAHDLKTPTTAIRWTLEKYQEPEYASKYPEIRNDIEMVNDLSARILQLAKDMTDVVKEGHTAVFQKDAKIDLCKCTQELLKEMNPALREKEITVKYAAKGKIIVKGDIGRLKEALGNLLENSIKYNRPKGEISISHTFEKKSVNTNIMHTDVAGIPPAVLPRLFQPFYRGEMEKRIPGTGLGLYISKKIIENMGGSVAVMCSTGKEVTFTVSLPRIKD